MKGKVNWCEAKASSDFSFLGYVQSVTQEDFTKTHAKHKKIDWIGPMLVCCSIKLPFKTHLIPLNRYHYLKLMFYSVKLTKKHLV